MTRIRALTLIVDEPSAAAATLSEVLGWTVEADFGNFASLTRDGNIPLWLNVPEQGQGTSCGVVLHVAADDVDAAFQQAVARGAEVLREPTDMDFGERSACVSTAATPGLTIDFSRPLD